MTLAFAAAQLAAGDTLYGRGATYTGTTNRVDSVDYTVPSGTDYSSGVITIAAYPGETVILQPPDGKQAVRLQTNAPHYLVFSGLIFDGSSQTVPAHLGGPSNVYLAGACHHVTFLNCESRNSAGNGYEFGTAGAGVADSIEIRGGSIHDNGRLAYANSGYGVYWKGSNHRIVGVEVYGNNGYGIHFNASATGFDNQIVGCRLHDNRVHGVPTVGGDTCYAIALIKATRTLIANTVIYANQGGILVYNDAADTLIYNNTITGNLGHSGGGEYAVQMQYHGTGTIIRNNILFSNANGAIQDDGDAVAAFGNYTADHNTTSDPGFFDSIAHDYRLVAASGPAYDTGTAVSEVTDDFLGTARPQGGSYDLGAYEWRSVRSSAKLRFRMRTAGSSSDRVRGFTITDGDGAVWLITGNVITRDGVVMPGNAYELGFVGGVVFVRNGGTWYRYDPTSPWGWTAEAQSPFYPDPDPVDPGGGGGGGGGGTTDPPGTESPDASPDGTRITASFVPITVFNGDKYILSDNEVSHDGVHFEGREIGKFQAVVFVTTQGSWWGNYYINGEVYGEAEELAYVNKKFYARTAEPQWYELHDGGNIAVVDPFALPEPTYPAVVGTRRCVGGWRVPQASGHGPMAIDFDTMTAYVGTRYENPAPVLRFDLNAVPMGREADPASWPLLQPVETIPEWWSAVMIARLQAQLAALNPNDAATRDLLEKRLGYDPYRAYASGFYYGDLTGSGKKLWVAPKVYYDSTPPSGTEVIARDGETFVVNLPRQAYAGFVKRGPGIRPYLGSGGNESGQGSVSGPTCGTLEGQPIVVYGRPDLPGDVDPATGIPAHWNERVARTPDYYPAFGVDGWPAWTPRTINGELQGRWASDRVYGGGLVLPEGITHFAWMGRGVLSYRFQGETFALVSQQRSATYVHDPVTGALRGYGATGINRVTGQELGPDGSVYLVETFKWAMESVTPNAPVISVFRY